MTLSRLVLFVLWFLSLSATAATLGDHGLEPRPILSSVEKAAIEQAQNVKFILGAVKKCDVLRDALAQGPIKQEQFKDGSGRVTMVRVGASVEFILEYANAQDQRPIAITGLGQKFLLTEKRHISKSIQQQFDLLRARTILYRQVKKICAIDTAPTGGVVIQDLSFGGEYDPDDWGGFFGGFSSDWLSSMFWENTWEPEYTDRVGEYYDFGGGSSVSPQVCINTCREVCDGAADVLNFGCAAIGGYIALANPVLGLGVGSACGLGTLVGKYYCRLQECTSVCTR
jgi:hypothetical protein